MFICKHTIQKFTIKKSDQRVTYRLLSCPSWENYIHKTLKQEVNFTQSL